MVQAGFEPARGEAVDCHILNTCAVTREASAEAKRVVRKLKTQNPFAKIIVTGCAAQVDTGMFSGLGGVDFVVANSHKKEIPKILKRSIAGEKQENVFKSKIFKKDEIDFGSGLTDARTRVFLKIQDGCDSFCSFCVIPYARGRSRSFSVTQIVQQIQELVALGILEVVLTGVHIGDFQDPLTPPGSDPLSFLVESILRRTKLARLRLSSLEPIEISDHLLELFSDSRVCPHFHLSLQSAQTQVLADMKRKYGQREVRNCLTKIERSLPQAYIGIDLIAGFPTETPAAFDETYAVMRDHSWTKLHVFPYSERPGTKAAQITENVYPHIRKERGKRLRLLSDDRVRLKAQAQVGLTKEILPLKNQNVGLSRDYWNVLLPESFSSGLETKFKIIGVQDELRNHQEFLVAAFA